MAAVAKLALYTFREENTSGLLSSSTATGKYIFTAVAKRDSKIQIKVGRLVGQMSVEHFDCGGPGAAVIVRSRVERVERGGLCGLSIPVKFQALFIFVSHQQPTGRRVFMKGVPVYRFARAGRWATVARPLAGNLGSPGLLHDQCRMSRVRIPTSHDHSGTEIVVY